MHRGGEVPDQHRSTWNSLGTRVSLSRRVDDRGCAVLVLQLGMLDSCGTIWCQWEPADQVIGGQVWFPFGDIQMIAMRTVGKGSSAVAMDGIVGI